MSASFNVLRRFTMTSQADDCLEDSKQLALEDFKLKFENVQNQYTRMWQRFGFFLTIELALFGLLFWAWLDGKPTGAVTAFVLGFLITLIWFVISAEDLWLLGEYRRRTDNAAAMVGKLFQRPDYEKEHPGVPVRSGFRNIGNWYLRLISVTRLPIGLASIAFLCWSFLCGFYVCTR